MNEDDFIEISEESPEPKKIVEYYVELFNLEDWEVYVESADDLNSSDWSAQCATDIDYRHATITVKNGTWRLPTLKQSLLHEVIHIVISPFNSYRDAVLKPIRMSGPGHQTLELIEDSLWTTSLESSVTALERGIARLERRHQEELLEFYDAL